MDHGGGSFGDGQEAVDAKAHFTMELVDGGPLERVAVVRHEQEAESIVRSSCWVRALALVATTSPRNMWGGKTNDGSPTERTSIVKSQIF